MKIILTQKHDTLGDVGEVVAVKAGYASNYLIPNGIAMAATPKNLKVIEQEKNRLMVAALREKKGAENLKKKLDTISVTAEVQVGEEERVFGAVTTQHIAELLAVKGFDVDRRKIVLDEPLKALGVYEVPVKLHPDVESMVKVWVVRQG